MGSNAHDVIIDDLGGDRRSVQCGTAEESE